jgi:subtilisin family serine protease
MGGAVEQMPPELHLMRVTVAPELLATLAALDEVAWIDPWGEPQTDLNLAREFSGANYLEEQTGFTGQGVRGEVMDTGIDVNHPDFQHTGGVLIHAGNSGSPGHGTEVTGPVFGDGTGNPAARGMSPSGKIVFASFFDVTNRPAHTAELVDPEDVYQCVFQTNSWGSPHSTLYTAVSAEMDDMIFDNDLLILNSQGNTGNNLSRPESWGKNVVGVGGVNHNNTPTTSDDFHCCGSTGPAADGRVKPDLVHFYDDILTTGPGGGYVVAGGTSLSTPITAGYFGLFHQMWHNDVFHNEPAGTTVFESRPHFSLAKAAMINTARQWAFSGASANLGRMHQGWAARTSTRRC